MHVSKTVALFPWCMRGEASVLYSSLIMTRHAASQLLWYVLWGKLQSDC